MDDTALMPPSELNFVGDGNFAEIGQHFVDIFRSHCGLQPQHRVLDVGCGIGRMAIPLTRFLSPQGSYEGFDIVDFGIEWCKQAITPRFPNFKFQLSDIFNRAYNTRGTLEAVDYRFPFADNEFDFTFLTSVFTHMIPSDLENYLYEVARTLKIGGTCLITFFLRNEDSLRLQAAGKSVFVFKHGRQGYWTVNPRSPEDAISYDETQILGLLEKYGMELYCPVQYGSWCGREKTTSSHDLVIARKARATTMARPRLSLVRRAARGLHKMIRTPLRQYVWKGFCQEAMEKTHAAAKRQRPAA